MRIRLRTWCIPLSVCSHSQGQAARRLERVQRLPGWPQLAGERPTVWRNSWAAASAVRCRGGKSGLAPASLSHSQALDALFDEAIDPGVEGIGLARAK